MIKDLRTILDGWDYELGKISVRKIIGRDGKERIQTRIDLGVLQFEIDGRPDGKKPHGFDSLLEYHENRLQRHLQNGLDEADFVLTPEDCRDLRQEGYMYYQRYLSQFVLEEFDAVERDTERNLRLIELCERHGGSEYDRRALSGQRGYVYMMNCRAQVYAALAEPAVEAALRRVEHGVVGLREMSHAARESEMDGEHGPYETELSVLLQLRREVINRLPVDAAARLQWELQAAIEREDYERAAQLRDKLSHLTQVGAKQAG